MIITYTIWKHSPILPDPFCLMSFCLAAPYTGMVSGLASLLSNPEHEQARRDF